MEILQRIRTCSLNSRGRPQPLLLVDSWSYFFNESQISFCGSLSPSKTSYYFVDCHIDTCNCHIDTCNAHSCHLCIHVCFKCSSLAHIALHWSVFIFNLEILFYGQMRKSLCWAQSNHFLKVQCIHLYFCGLLLWAQMGRRFPMVSFLLPSCWLPCWVALLPPDWWLAHHPELKVTCRLFLLYLLPLSCSPS